MTYPEHWRWRAEALSPGPAAIFDIDGVLSDASGRQHFLEGAKPQWGDFFDDAINDPLLETSSEIASTHPDWTIILLTGRPLRIRDDTISWLGKHDLRWDLLIMRERGNYAKAREFKRETVRDLRSRGFELKSAYDDDELICKMFEEEGVACTYVHSGYYEQRVVRFPRDAGDFGETGN